MTDAQGAVAEPDGAEEDVEHGGASSSASPGGKGGAASKPAYKSVTGFGIRKKLGIDPKPEGEYKSVTGLDMRKKLGIQPKTEEEKKQAAEAKKQKESESAAKKKQKEEAARQKEEERQVQKARFLEGMLPWTFETQVTAYLGMIKVPIICFVAVLGICTENHLKSSTKQSWLRPGSLAIGSQTSCYVHHLTKETQHHSLIDFDLVGSINKTLLSGHLHGDIFTSNITLDPGFGHHDTCNVDLNTCRVRGLDHPSYYRGGVDHFIPFALIWFIYKILFIGVHPIDRIALKLAGDPPVGPDYPEPLMKLITEPYFQFCTTPMQVVVKVLCYLRYKLMPNALLGALASMHDMSPKCPRIVYYRMDSFFGTACYFQCIIDLFGIVGVYVMAKVKMDGQLIGRWRYRMWKTFWLISSIFVTFNAINAALYTFGGIGEILRAIGSCFVIVLKLNFSLHLGVDVMRVMNYIIMLLEFLELLFLITGVLYPKLFKRMSGEDDSENPAYQTLGGREESGRVDGRSEEE
eukprot:CAMPEP_0171100030 /NCGR_PEP_ID=MMETSP0766_2-20121228/52711_1 /TAXON_ID=439317 /ORGANISM="Gambierdiscus australes, Strain CAWD 149" /LENGTH=519 /DNA_ID=CAMNT_0011559779 /DNA_START=21 /DNA_END=1580 /DNA_ORIENTATION=+